MADASLDQLNAYLVDHSYIGGECATLLDYEQCARVDAVDAKKLPHLGRWYVHISYLLSRHGRSLDCYGTPVPAGTLPRLTGETAKRQPAPADVQRSSASPFHFCVLDFEKTCENREIDASFGPQEIIEFPSVLLARDLAESVVEFESFVKPHVHPLLSHFCTELTGITQEHVDGAKDLSHVLAEHHTWLRGIVPRDEDCVFVTCGDMDLKRSLPEDPNLPSEVPACYRKWLNIKKEFSAFYTQWYKKGKQPRNMVEMLDKLEISLEGQHHSGIDDCRNIAKILQQMLGEGWTPKV